MKKKGVESRSRRKPLREIDNVVKPAKPPTNKSPDKESQIEGDAVDRLLLVQSNLSSLVNQVDGLVVQAIKVKTTGHQGSKCIESFTTVLSDMISTLKPWVPKFQAAISNPRTVDENQLEEARKMTESPKKCQPDSLVSPSPFVSWRGDCTIERGRQLFLLTPLPMSNAPPSTHQRPQKSLFERVGSHGRAGLPPLCRSITEDLKTDNPLLAAEVEPASDGFASPPTFLNRNSSMLVATPCLNVSPPKSCAFLQPASRRGSVKCRKATPFPRGVPELSESSADQASKSLARRYPELYGIQKTEKAGIRRGEAAATVDWFMSPPKTCVLMEPPDERRASKGTGRCYLINKIPNTEAEGSGVAVIECTPLWREAESSVRRGRRAGETTLKRELWTRFEAASSADGKGLQFDAAVFQQVPRNGFLERLDEVCCDDGASVSQCSR